MTHSVRGPRDKDHRTQPGCGVESGAFPEDVHWHRVSKSAQEFSSWGSMRDKAEVGF